MEHTKGENVGVGGDRPVQNTGEGQSSSHTTVFRCQQGNSCSFRLHLHHPLRQRQDFWFTLGKKGVNAHSGHELKKPMRATKVLLEVMEDCKANAAKDGSIRIELQKKTLIAMSEAFGGEDAMNESTFNLEPCTKKA
jgi:hypothetical protein